MNRFSLYRLMEYSSIYKLQEILLNPEAKHLLKKQLIIDTNFFLNIT